MATRKTAATAAPSKTRRAPRKTAAKKAAPSAPRRAAAMPGAEEMQAQMSRMANLMTPEQAIELYKANARMALDVGLARTVDYFREQAKREPKQAHG